MMLIEAFLIILILYVYANIFITVMKQAEYREKLMTPFEFWLISQACLFITFHIKLTCIYYLYYFSFWSKNKYVKTFLKEYSE